MFAFLGPAMLAALGAVGSGMWLNRRAMESPDLRPRWDQKDPKSWDLSTVGMGAGGALALLGGSLLGPIGLGVAAGSWLQRDTGNLIRQNVTKFVMNQAMLTDGAAPSMIPPVQQQRGGGQRALPGLLARFMGQAQAA